MIIEKIICDRCDKDITDMECAQIKVEPASLSEKYDDSGNVRVVNFAREGYHLCTQCCEDLHSFMGGCSVLAVAKEE